MSFIPATSRRNALTGSIMLIAALGLMFTLPFQVEAARPTAPTNLEGFVTNNSVTLLWDAASGGTEPTDYEIFRRNNREDPNGPLISIWTISGRDGPPTAMRDSGKMGGSRDYEYAVAAVNDDGVSGQTNRFTALVPASALSQANTWRSHSLTATHSGSQVTLNWEVISTAGIQGYKIRKKVGGGRFTTLVQNTGNGDRTYVDTAVQSGKTYTYRIRAHYEYGSMTGKGTTSERAEVTIP